MKCRNCKKSNFDRIIKIGKQPISSKTYKFKKKLKKYSLDLFQCKSCKLIQLSKRNAKYMQLDKMKKKERLESKYFGNRIINQLQILLVSNGVIP